MSGSDENAKDANLPYSITCAGYIAYPFKKIRSWKSKAAISISLLQKVEQSSQKKAKLFKKCLTDENIYRRQNAYFLFIADTILPV